ncbi:uncharacterized protein IWZ02DRAFT_263572 [Phyllosticta citriasiana]|uniref:Uncharacterized protein n=1 Tax=Phyllosticta citriasiana TaxID=595635 RepID=A0ABR1KSC7_9PEZI
MRETRFRLGVIWGRKRERCRRRQRQQRWVLSESRIGAVAGDIVLDGHDLRSCHRLKIGREFWRASRRSKSTRKKCQVRECQRSGGSRYVLSVLVLLAGAFPTAVEGIFGVRSGKVRWYNRPHGQIDLVFQKVVERAGRDTAVCPFFSSKIQTLAFCGWLHRR